MSQFNHLVFLKDNGGFLAMDDRAFINLLSQSDTTEYVDGKAVRTRTFTFQYVEDNDIQIEIR